MSSSPKSLYYVKENDSVIIYIGYNKIFFLDRVKRGEILNTREGNFHHVDIIDRPYGSKVFDRKTQRWCCVLRPSPDLIARSLTLRTQIIYPTDTNCLLMMLHASPGNTIIDCGTGSGAFTLQLANAVRPCGVIHTFEIHPERYKHAQEDFCKYKFDDTIHVHHRDVYQEGFKLYGVEGPYADAVFLDLPEPWKAVGFAKENLKPLGWICTFSPCIEQIQKTVEALRENGFDGIRVFENLSKKWGFIKTKRKEQKTKPQETQSNPQVTQTSQKPRSLKRQYECCNLSLEDLSDYQFQYPMRSHTSYLLISRAPVIWVE